MSFVTDPKTIDFEEAQKEITEYVQSMPEAQRWTDFFRNSAGTLIIRLIAGLKTFLGYQTIVARREAYASTAQNRSSIIGIAQRNGYSVNRGRNARVNVLITPTVNQTIEPFEIVGSIKDYDLIAIEQAYLVPGTPNTIKCIVGRVTEETKTVNTTNPTMFRFELPKVTEDYKLELQGNEVATSSRLIMANDAKFVVQTNPIDSVDIFYLNSLEFPVRYQVGDELKLTFVERSDVDFVASDVMVDLAGVDSTQIIDLAQPPEATEAIVINSAIYNETQFVIRARTDYEKVFSAIRPSLVDTGYRDVSPSVIELFYITNDGTFYTPEEEEEILQELMLYRSMGLQPPTMGKSIRNKVNLGVRITLIKPVADILDKVDTIVKAYEYKFRTPLDLSMIENQIEDIDGVKIARITIAPNAWAANTRYELGSYVRSTPDNGRVYRLTEFRNLSDSTEPVWPTVVGDTIIDNDIVWECKYLERQCDPLEPQLPIIPPRGIWLPDHNYRIGEVVIPTVLGIHEYKAIGFITKSNATEPVWPALNGDTPSEIQGQEVLDGKLVWMARPLEGTTPDAWEADKHYDKGDLVMATNPTDSDTVGVMFQVIAITGSTAGTQPVWPTVLRDQINDNDMIWTCFDPAAIPDPLNGDTYYVLTTSKTII